MPHNETEIKLKVSSVRAIKCGLTDLGFVIIERRHRERNFLFDFPDLRLRKSSSVVRLRCEGKRSILTFKGPPRESRDYKIRREIETEIGDARIMREILESLGLSEIFRYEKFRTTYAPSRKSETPAGGLVMVDETPIGNFLELEGPKRWIGAVARRLGFRRPDYISASYVSLYHARCLEDGRKPGNMVFAAKK
ncbi:MAG: class IV adenylate cyclase [Terriglobia bacterium]